MPNLLCVEDIYIQSYILGTGYNLFCTSSYNSPLSMFVLMSPDQLVVSGAVDNCSMGWHKYSLFPVYPGR